MGGHGALSIAIKNPGVFKVKRKKERKLKLKTTKTTTTTTKKKMIIVSLCFLSNL